MKTQAVVRPGQAADLDGIEHIETIAFASDRLSRRSLRSFLKAPTTATVVAEEDGRIVGYAMIGFRADSPRGRIFTLAVDPCCGGRGIGRALLTACEAAAVERRSIAIRLEVRADNLGALRLYESAGYRRFAETADYYEDGASAIRLEKPCRAAPAM